MTKIRLNKAHRDTLLSYGQEKIAALVDRAKETALYDTLIAGANAAIRAKYPEEHMAVLRQYKLTRHDRCLRFQFPSGRVDGFTFFYEDAEKVADLPSRAGCLSSDAFPMDAAFEAAFDAYAKEEKANADQRRKKQADFDALVESAKTLDDVMAVIDLPADIQERLGRKSTALVALSAETLASLRDDFAIKAAA